MGRTLIPIPGFPSSYTQPRWQTRRVREARTGAQDTIKCGAPNLKVAFGRVQIFLFISVPSKINPVDKDNLLFPDNFVNNSELTFTDTILILFTL